MIKYFEIGLLLPLSEWDFVITNVLVSKKIKNKSKERQ